MTTSSAMLGWPPAGMAGASTAWHGDVEVERRSRPCTQPVNEPMSTVCSEPFATEPPPTESAASLEAVTAPGGELARAHRSGAQIGREHLAVDDLRRAHGAGRRGAQRAHRCLGQVGLGDGAVLDLLAGDRALADEAAVHQALLAWAGPPSATNRAMRATTIAGDGRRRMMRM